MEDVLHTPAGNLAQLVHLPLGRQGSKGLLGLEKAAQDVVIGRAHQGGKEVCLAPVVAIKGPSGHPHGLDNLPQGGPLKAFGQKLLPSRLVDALQGGQRLG